MSFAERTEDRDELLSKGFTFVQKSSKDFTPGDMLDLGLIDLVMRGYGYTGNEVDGYANALAEFAEAGRDRFSLLALKDGKAVSAVSFGRWRNSHESKRGNIFWYLLRNADPKLAEKALESSDEVYDMIGIVTLPEYRQHGLAKKLLMQGIREGRPSFVVGESKTPQAVITRSRALKALGYRTFYGRTEVTPGNEQEESYLATLLSRVYANTYSKSMEDFPVVYTTTDVLLPTVPEVSDFPPIIQSAFATIREAQMRAGDARTAVQPMISVAEGLLTSI